MPYTSKLSTVLCVFIISTIPSWELLSSPSTKYRHKRSHSLPSSQGNLLLDIEEQLLQKHAQQKNKIAECSACACPSIKAVFLAGLIFSAGWVLKDIFKVVTKVDTGLESIGKKLDEVRDRLDGDHTPWCPDARIHMEKMYQALQSCNTPSTPDQSWYIQEDLLAAQPTIADSDVTFASCPAAKLHFTLMLKSFRKCWSPDSTWFNPAEMPT